MDPKEVSIGGSLVFCNPPTSHPQTDEVELKKEKKKKKEKSEETKKGRKKNREREKEEKERGEFRKSENNISLTLRSPKSPSSKYLSFLLTSGSKPARNP